MENILIIGAHYDDTELGSGGTGAKLVAEGKNVYKLTLTDNATNFHQMNIKVEYDTSLISSKKASEILGIKEINDFTPIKCTHLEYNTETMQKIEKIIYDYKIDTVFIHFSDDMNQDHIAAYKLCLTAARHCSNILAYQSNGYILDREFYPTFFIDISNYVEKKKEALCQYGDEHNRFNRLFEINIERNKVWGYANNVKYAEGFHVIKMLL